MGLVSSFVKNSLRDRPLLGKQRLLERYLAKTSRPLSSYSFLSLFLWKDFFDFEFEEVDGHLCVLAQNEVGCFLYLPPLSSFPHRGRKGVGVIEKYFQKMKLRNKGSGVTRIENIDQSQIPFFDERWYRVTKKADEYVYRREDIAGLKGNDYKSKRSDYNHFVKNNRYDFLSFEAGMISGCMDLYEHWAEERLAASGDEVYRHMIEENRFVHRLAMDYYKELDLVGRVVSVDDQIRAYTFGYRLNENTFCVLLEVADLSLKGLPTFIFSEFCRDDAVSPFEFINAMDDFGMENVERTKLSFRPHKILPVYTATQE